MRLLVLGAGLQGSACAYNLLRHPEVESVTLTDLAPGRLPPFLADLAGERLQLRTLDANDYRAAVALAREHAATLCALPYYFNETMTRAAIEAGSHFADLGGNTEIVMRQQRHDPEAAARGVSVIPDCGVAPGMVNILAAEGIRRLDRARSVRIYAGGLPQQPEGPLNYQVVYSLEGALDYYTTPSWILRGGRPVQVDALSGLESQEFPPPIGLLEAFHTGGGISVLPFEYAGRVDSMEYKTLRYPGHLAVMRPIRDLGLLADAPIVVKGQTVRPREVFIATVEPRLRKPDGRDVIVLRVVASGVRGDRDVTIRFELIDYYDAEHGISAMMRTTGYSLALTGLMQARGEVTAVGVRTPDRAVPFRPYVEGLARFGVQIRETTT
jgi:lysine 6-dehydrogenase